MHRSALVAVVLTALWGCGDSETTTDDDGGGGGGGAGNGGGGNGPLSLTFIDDHNIPAGTLLSGVQLGGLSGLWVDPQSGHAWAICDDQAEYAAPRFYELDISLNETVLTVTPASFTSFDTGATPDVETDAEGIARAPSGDLYISLEGDTTPVVAPAILRVGADGTLAEELTVDAKFVPDAGGQIGVRRNMGFEGLSLAPSGAVLFYATERALAQDGPVADFEVGTPCRIVVHDTTGQSPAVEHLYVTEPVPPASPGTLGEVSNGISEILAISDDRLWVMERASVQVDGAYTNHIRIFEVELADADDIAADATLAEGAMPLAKRLVLDFDTLLPVLDPAYPSLDNFEAMSFGPTLADGRRTLIAMSDDNFNVGLQRTAFFAFLIDD